MHGLNFKYKNTALRNNLSLSSNTCVQLIHSMFPIFMLITSIETCFQKQTNKQTKVLITSAWEVLGSYNSQVNMFV